MKSFLRTTLILLLTAAGAHAIEVTWSPPRPTFQDPITIAIDGCTQGGVLHWGVNADGHTWVSPPPAQRPAGSTMDGVAVRSPLLGPDTGGVCRITLGPFTNRQVSSVDFAIQWENRNWDNHMGEDFHIPIGPLRITVEPEHPTLNDTLVVTVHDSQPGGLLHWGINAEPDRWNPPHPFYRPPGTRLFPDGQAVETPLPAPGEDGSSRLRLGPFNSAAQVVTSLHMVVRWDSNWDTDFGRNYNVNLLREDGVDGPHVTFLSPEAGAQPRGDLTARLEVEKADRVELWLDGEEVANMVTAPFVWRRPLESLPYGRHEMVARAVKGKRAYLAQTDFWNLPAIKEADLPAGARPGATVHEDGTATFVLYAPGKRLVALVGDFNQWNPLSDILTRAPDGTWWTRRPVNPGTHTYQYLVDGAHYLADPYSVDVTWQDEKGDETYIPKLAKSVLVVGRPPYVWKDAAYQRPPLDNLLIYEFAIDDLCPGQGFTGVIARLDYIRDLGATAIEPLPWTEFTGAESWGYNPSFHFAPETAYGTPDELRALIDAAHQRGLAVIMDVVLNHMDEKSPLYQLYGKDLDASPYFRHFTGENWGFPDIDQRSPAVKRYAADLVRFWQEEYHVDGFRYDATRWVEWSGHHDWGASWFAYAAKQTDPTSYQIAEHLPTDPALMNTTEMDASWHARFRWRLRDMLEKAELDADEFKRIMDPRRVGFTNVFQRVAYVESHDEERVFRVLMEKDHGLDDALTRAQTAAAITLTAPGITMLYSGQEFAELTPRVVGPNPLRWEQLELPPFARLHDVVAKLGRLRTGHPGLQSEAIAFPTLDPEQGTAAYLRGVPDEDVLVAVNFSRQPRSWTLELPDGSAWQRVAGPEALTESGGEHTIALPAGATAVYQRGWTASAAATP